jgi:hypothetical protein
MNYLWESLLDDEEETLVTEGSYPWESGATLVDSCWFTVCGAHDGMAQDVAKEVRKPTRAFSSAKGLKKEKMAEVDDSETVSMLSASYEVFLPEKGKSKPKTLRPTLIQTPVSSAPLVEVESNKKEGGYPSPTPRSSIEIVEPKRHARPVGHSHVSHVNPDYAKRASKTISPRRKTEEVRRSLERDNHLISSKQDYTHSRRSNSQINRRCDASAGMPRSSTRAGSPAPRDGGLLGWLTSSMLSASYEVFLPEQSKPKMLRPTMTQTPVSSAPLVEVESNKKEGGYPSPTPRSSIEIVEPKRHARPVGHVSHVNPDYAERASKSISPRQETEEVRRSLERDDHLRLSKQYYTHSRRSNLQIDRHRDASASMSRSSTRSKPVRRLVGWLTSCEFVGYRGAQEESRDTRPSYRSHSNGARSPAPQGGNVHGFQHESSPQTTVQSIGRSTAVDRTSTARHQKETRKTSFSRSSHGVTPTEKQERGRSTSRGWYNVQEYAVRDAYFS